MMSTIVKERFGIVNKDSDIGGIYLGMSGMSISTTPLPSGIDVGDFGIGHSSFNTSFWSSNTEIHKKHMFFFSSNSVPDRFNIAPRSSNTKTRSFNTSPASFDTTATGSNTSKLTFGIATKKNICFFIPLV